VTGAGDHAPALLLLQQLRQRAHYIISKSGDDSAPDMLRFRYEELTRNFGCCCRSINQSVIQSINASLFCCSVGQNATEYIRDYREILKNTN